MRRATMTTRSVWGALVVTAAMAVGGDLNPVAPPGPTMKPLDQVEPRIAVQSLAGDQTSRFIIDQPGSYYLTSDITVGRDVHGIRIDADHVTLDLMGYRIWSSWSTTQIMDPPSSNGSGIYVSGGHKHIEIRNGQIASDSQIRYEGWPVPIMYLYRGFRHGINAPVEGDSWPDDIRVVNVRVAHATFNGIYMVGENHLVMGCSATNNGMFGISLGDNSRVVNCVVSGNQDGVSVRQHCLVQGCAAAGNSWTGIHALDYCLIIDNVTSDNDNRGIWVGDGATVRGNVCAGNHNEDDTACGILASGADVLKGNTVEDNDIGLLASNGCSILDNVARGNRKWGIRAGAYCLIDRNVAYDNDQSGQGYPQMFWANPVSLGVNQNPMP